MKILIPNGIEGSDKGLVFYANINWDFPNCQSNKCKIFPKFYLVKSAGFLQNGALESGDSVTLNRH